MLSSSELSPSIFSPRPPIPLKSSARTSSCLARIGRTKFSYVLSTESIQVKHPSAFRERRFVEELESKFVGLSLTSDIEEAVSFRVGDKDLKFFPEAQLDVRSSYSLRQRRGIHLPDLTLNEGARRTNGMPSSTESEKTLIDSPYPLANEKYDVIEEIGNDSEGPCTLVRRKKDRELRVIKSVREPTMAFGKPIEACVLQDLYPQRHDNIIQLHSYEYIEQLGLVQYEFEYCSGGDLHDLCYQYEVREARFPELFLWNVFLQLGSALEYLHRGFQSSCERQGIVHRDVKPENIFLRRSIHGAEYPDAVLSDFGSAVFDFATYEPVGTFKWQPPEIPRKTPKGDVYALGAVMHQMIHLASPILDLPAGVRNTERNLETWEAAPASRSPLTDVP